MPSETQQGTAATDTLEGANGLEPFLSGVVDAGRFLPKLWELLAAGPIDPRQAPAVAATLGRLLVSPEPAVRRQAHFAMCLIGPAADAVVPDDLRRQVVQLHHAEPSYREGAANRIGHRGREAAAVWEAVGQALAGDAEADVRERAAVTLGEIREPASRLVLETALADPVGLVASRSADALGALGMAESLPALFALLRRETCAPMAGESAAGAIRRIRGEGKV